MATLRKITLNWEIRTGAITCDTGYIKRQELCDVDLYVTVDGTAYALDTSWALNLSIKPTLLGDNAALIAVTTWTASATTGLYQATAQTMGGAALDTYLAANNSDTTDDEGNKLVDLDVYYTISTAVKSKSDTVTLILKPDVGRADDTVPATIIARNDFLVSNGTGLLVNVAAGYAANGAFVAAQASLAITNATNYIEVTAAGVASVNTTAFTAGSYPLATVVASAGAITSNTDLRAWITPKPAAAGGVTSITGTANEITVTGTTTPTLSLPSALTFTGKTITGGTFASPTLTTPTIGDGTEAAPSLSFTSDTDTGVYRPAADTVGIVGGGNDVVRLTGIASATDYLEIKNGIGVGSPLHVLASGPSTNIGMHLQPKGSGLLTISDGTDFNKGIRFRCSSSAASAITLLDAVSTAGRVITLPDATGTLALVSGNLGTPSALVGTNITGTASGLTAGNATLAATVTVANEATDTTCFPLFATAATGSLAALSNAGLTFNSATGLLSATGLAGAFNGTVGATTPSTVAGTTGTFSGAVTGATFNAVKLNIGLGNDSRSIALGEFALASTTTGTNNYAIGRSALTLTTTGSDNVAFGGAALASNVTGDENTAIGASALTQALGSRNVALGHAAGQYETGSDSLYIDNQDRTNTAGDKAKALIYGTFAATAAAQQLTINAGTITLNGSAVTATSFSGAGSGLTSLNASNVSSGTLADARLSANVPLKDAANTFTAANTFSTSINTPLISPTANTLEVRNGTTSQVFRNYGYYADASNYCRFALDYNEGSNLMTFTTEGAGTRANRNFGIMASGTGILYLGAASDYRWRVTSTGLLAHVDNTYDIGASGATRPRHLYVGSNGVFGGTLSVTGASTLTGTVTLAATSGLQLKLGTYSSGASESGGPFFSGFQAEDANQSFFTLNRANSGNSVMGGGVSGEAFRRVLILASGAIGVGPGTATRDVWLHRSAANTWTISSDGSTGAGNLAIRGTLSVTGATTLSGDVNLSKTITAAATTGAQTINKNSGAVNFAAAATSLVVTNSLCTVNSVVTVSIGTNDATASGVKVVPAAGSFTIYLGVAPTAETRVYFHLTN